VPRRITLSRMARQSGRSAPALGKILRRAEGRLVAHWLATEGAPVEPTPETLPDAGER
jgi:predicted DNA binding protein